MAYSPDEMDECLNEFKNYELILVDTAGRSHKSDEQMEELENLYLRLRREQMSLILKYILHSVLLLNIKTLRILRTSISILITGH